MRETLGPFEEHLARFSAFVDGAQVRRREVLGAFAFLQRRFEVRGAVTQEEHDRVRAQLASALGGNEQRLAALVLGGYSPWFRKIAASVDRRKLSVLYPSAGVDFSLRPRGESASFLEQILFVVVDYATVRGRPTVFVPRPVALSGLETRLAELAPAYQADELVVLVPVPARVLKRLLDPPAHPRLVPVSYGPADLPTSGKAHVAELVDPCS